MKLDDKELFWLVGLLEGEGCFSYCKKTHEVALKMTDEDIIWRAHALFMKLTGKDASVRTVRAENDRCQESFSIALYGKNAITIMKAVLPYMGWRRRRRIWQCLNKHIEKRRVVDMKAIVNNVIQMQKTA